jgi:hypothetical protein
MPRNFDSRYGCHKWWFAWLVLQQQHELRLFLLELLLVRALKGYAVGDTFEVNVTTLPHLLIALTLLLVLEQPLLVRQRKCGNFGNFRVRVSATNTVVWYRVA